MGMILESLGKHAEAEPALRKATTYLQKLLADTPRERTYRKALADNQKNRGDEAETAYRRAIDLFRILAEEFPGDVYQESLASCQFLLADLLQHSGRLQEAELTYQQILSIQQKLAVNDPTGSHRYGLANTYRELGAVLETSNKLSEIEDCYQRAVQILEQLIVQFPTIPRNRHALAWTYAHLGNLLRQNGKLARAEELFRKGIVLSMKLMEEFPSTPGYTEGLGRNQIGLANVLRHTNQSQQAEQAYRQALESNERLVAAIPTRIVNSLLLAHRRTELADLLAELGRHEESDREYHQALTVLVRVVEQQPQNATVHNDAAWSLVRFPGRGQVALDHALSWARKAVELAPTAANFNTLGAAYYRAGQWTEAIAALEKSMEIGEGGNSFDWFFLAMAHSQLGQNEQARKYYDQGVDSMDKGRAVNEELVRLRDEAAQLQKLADDTSVK
jgi:tetratricopeptide (TPR) repeat protein